MNRASIGRPLIVDIQLDPALEATAETYLPYVLFRCLPAPMDGKSKRRGTGLGTGAENWL